MFFFTGILCIEARVNNWETAWFGMFDAPIRPMTVHRRSADELYATLVGV